MSINLRAKLRAKKSGDEQRHIAESLQGALPRDGRRRIQRVGQHVRERPDAQPVGGMLVEGVGARKHREQVDDVLFGLLVDVEMLMFARCVKCVTKKFAQ